MTNANILTELSNLFIRATGTIPTDIIKMPESGSYRQYFRLTTDKESIIGIYNSDIKENEAFVHFAKTFFSAGAAVPEIIAEHPSKLLYLQTDLGNTSLFDITIAETAKGTFSEELKSLYKQTLTELIKLQTTGAKKLDYNYCYPRDAFDNQSIQWDLNYFKYYFLKIARVGFDEQLLEVDFKTLIDFLLSADTTNFLFRDFQGRNIMIKDGAPFFIDFQGGRRGGLYYDPASLLFDAKAAIPYNVREELWQHYKKEAASYLEEGVNADKLYLAYTLIRVMQAFGAFGFRGLIEGKQHFIDSIPFALNDLSFILKNNTFPIEAPTLERTLHDLLKSDHLKSLLTC